MSIEPRASHDDNPFGAFVLEERAVVSPTGDGPLSGLDFVIKDSFDIAGYATGGGSPTWLALHPHAESTGPAIRSLLDAGARAVGKTQMDELGWSLNGVNRHYGIPVNPKAPDRIPGGSSSGSAVAVAGGIVPFSLAADGGGSVRLPASHCGIFGMRPSHGRVSTGGAMEMAPSVDTIGWFAKDAELLQRVGHVLLGGTRGASAPGRLLIATDLFHEADDQIAHALAPAIHRVEEILGTATPIRIARGELESWRDMFKTVQAGEIWQTQGEWVTRNQPDFGADIAARFQAASEVSAADLAEARDARDEIRSYLHDALADGAILLAPTTPALPPLRTSSIAQLDEFRGRALKLLCLGGIAGLAQVSLPLAEADGVPVGLSLIAAPGNDELLLDMGRRITEA